MKICHIVDELKIGGLEKTVLQITLNLKGYSHEVWCLKNKGVLAQELAGSKVIVREFGFRGAMTFGALYKLVRELKSGKFDIVHAHGVYPFVWAGIAGFISRLPVIHHAQSLYYGLSFKEKLRLKYLSVATKKIIAVSNAVRDNLENDMGINGEKIEVVYNAAEDLVLSIKSKRDEVRKSFGVNPGDFLIGSVGRLEKYKGHNVLLSAIAECLKKNINLKCIVVGDGPAKEDLLIHAERMGISKHVIFTGFRSDMPGVICAMDLLVQPSILREGLPLVLAEGASLSLPLIASDVGGNREIVSDGVNGFIVPPNDVKCLADKILYIYEHPVAAADMGMASRKIWSERFRLESMLAKLDRIYKECR